MSSLESKAVRGVQFMVSLQLATRVLTFGLNTFVLRHAAPEILGAASQLQLVLNLTLFLSREAVRRASARCNDEQGLGLLPWLAPVLGIFFGAAVGYVWLWGASAAEIAVPQFVNAVILTVVAALVELLSEPAFAQAQRELQYRGRFVAESAAVLSLCVTLYVSVVWMQLGLLGWGIAQLSHAVVLSSLTYIAAPGLPDPRKRPSGAQWRLLGAFQWQATQQLVLQEGERLVLKVRASLLQQGVYSVVAALGSLVVRSFFLPLEEVAGAYFARLLAQSSKGQQRETSRVLASIVRLLVAVSALLGALGPPLAFFALDFLYGDRLSASAAPAILRAYCGYVGLLGLNGVSEAFVRAAISPAQQYRLNGILVTFSILHVAACYVLLDYFHGSLGLVYANCLGMVLRLFYSAHFVQNYFSEFGFPWRSALPSVPVLVWLLVARVSLDYASPFLCLGWRQSGCWMLVALGGAFFLGTLVLLYVFDRAWLLELRDFWRGRKSTTGDSSKTKSE